MSAIEIPVRIGLIGCGAIGKLHAERLKADPRAEIAVLCDPDLSRAERLRAELSLSAEVASEPQAALAAAGLRAAVIASPTLSHYEQVCLAFELGLDVLCEKPLAARREEIADLIERRDRLGRILSVSYQRRYKAPYRTARRELAERADWYGPLNEVHVFVCERWQQTIHGTWRDDPLVGAGYFGDAGSHQIDVVHFITGRRPEAVLAQSDRCGSRVEIVTRVLARMTGGAGLVAHFVGRANHWSEDIYFHCRDADLLLRNEKLSRAKQNRVEPVADLLPEVSPNQAFLDGILAGTATLSPAEAALPMYDWTAAVLQSIGSGDWVALDAQAR
ncbi:MAG TPA: Gfo/Idh/MocA family oxidoreductase [Pirellulales bacterium]|nr:Gfo/Idh/MocA family oxidoreductase [Pirellulales bacterium]